MKEDDEKKITIPWVIGSLEREKTFMRNAKTGTPKIVVGPDGTTKDVIACPDCGCDRNYLLTSFYQEGNDNYEADWWGRGSLVVNKMSCEDCASHWFLLIGFHKGNTYIFTQGSRVNYYEYIQSNAWKEKADAAKKRAGFRCQICNSGTEDGARLNAHHRTYERLGSELDEDITVLCKDCHELYEKNKKQKRSKRS